MRIGFIGAGKVGSAIGLYLKRHSLQIAGYYSRSLKSAEKAAEITDSDCFDSIKALAVTCDLLFITTPDQALVDVDRQVSALLFNHSISRNKIWLHASGAYPSDCLAGIKSEGCPVGSMHPLQSFGDPYISAELLEKTFFSIEGSPEALQVIKAILQKTKGNYNEISSGQKPLYHAGACIISNYLVTLLDCGMQLMELAGMDKRTLFQAVSPLIDGTLKNIQENGTVDALTGPVARGDHNTVALHLKAIEAANPGQTEIYRALALQTISMIEKQRLNREQTNKFKELLKGCGNNGE